MDKLAVERQDLYTVKLCASCVMLRVILSVNNALQIPTFQRTYIYVFHGAIGMFYYYYYLVSVGYS